MRNQPNNTSGNQHHHDCCREGHGGPIHNMQIGFAPILGTQASEQLALRAGATTVTLIPLGRGARRCRVLSLESEAGAEQRQYPRPV